MAWNEPGGGKKDPWGNRNNDGPPDLDEVFRKLQQKFGGLFGGKRGGGGESATGGVLMIVLFIFVAAWVIVGFYIVDEGERGVVLRFGKYLETTEPGMHWYPPIIEKVEQVNVTSQRSANGNAQVLTGDENIVHVAFNIQYNIKSAGDYLFNVKEPDMTLHQASESAFRELIGKNTLDYVIQNGRDEVPPQVKDLLQENLDLYGTGISVLRVNLTSAQPPQEVQDAFDDAIKAREDKDRFIKEAEAYSNDIIPKARGDAQQQLEQAKAYKFSLIRSAEGEADRFTKLLTEYHKAPKVTRERLYLETLEYIMANSGKVMVDVDGGNNLMYLPLDKIVGGHSGNVYIEPAGSDSTTTRQNRYESPFSKSDSDNRSRGAR